MGVQPHEVSELVKNVSDILQEMQTEPRAIFDHAYQFNMLIMANCIYKYYEITQFFHTIEAESNDAL